MIFRKPIVLVLVCDGFMNMSMRWLYGALSDWLAGRLSGSDTMQPFERTTDYSLLQAEGLKVVLAIPPPTEDDIRQFRETIARLDPLWIGFHVLNPTNHVAVWLCREARSVCRAPIIWGGAAAIGTPEAVSSTWDLVCTGEGSPWWWSRHRASRPGSAATLRTFRGPGRATRLARFERTLRNRT